MCLHVPGGAEAAIIAVKLADGTFQAFLAYKLRSDAPFSLLKLSFPGCQMGASSPATGLSEGPRGCVGDMNSMYEWHTESAQHVDM